MGRYILHFLAVSLAVLALAVDSSAGSDQSYVFNFGDKVWKRPANLYRLSEYADKGICVSVLDKLNEPYLSERPSQNSYFGLFTNNSTTLPWQKRTESSTDPIYFLQHDMDGDGVDEWVYKAYAPVSGKYIAFLTIVKTALGDSKDSDRDITRIMYKHDIISYEKKRHNEVSQSTDMMDSETSFMKIDQSESLVVLSGESRPDRFCKEPYEVFAFLANTKKEEMPLPFCRFKTTKHVQCKFPH